MVPPELLLLELEPDVDPEPLEELELLLDEPLLLPDELLELEVPLVEPEPLPLELPELVVVVVPRHCELSVAFTTVVQSVMFCPQASQASQLAAVASAQSGSSAPQPQLQPSPTLYSPGGQVQLLGGTGAVAFTVAEVMCRQAPPATGVDL